MVKLYFVDGYHGGIRGHMPVGSWQDIIHALQEYPEWKISLEIEPLSWEYLYENDRDGYEAFKSCLNNESVKARIEFVSGSFSQPFCWGINGESIIRNFYFGHQILKKHFSNINVDTYAVQEPCFTSSLPQILTQLGFRRICLKNSTAWGGYVDKMQGAFLMLKGNNGSSIPCVPRYECEELIFCHSTEGSGYDRKAIKNYAEKCEKYGIKYPIGMCLQDLGWAARPLLDIKNIHYTTWREYFTKFFHPDAPERIFSQEDIRVALPWGHQVLSEMLGLLRKAENKILQAEKLLTIAEITCKGQGRTFNGRAKLEEAWEHLMHAHHHDGFICADAFKDKYKWSFHSQAHSKASLDISEKVISNVFSEVNDSFSSNEKEKNSFYLRVFSSDARQVNTQAVCPIGLEYGYRGLRVYDENGSEVPSQFTTERKYSDGCICGGILRIETKIDGIGFQSFKVLLEDKEVLPNSRLASSNETFVHIQTKIYDIVFDMEKGGNIVRLFDKITNIDYASNDAINYLQGFSIRENRFIDNKEVKAHYEILENGPLCAKLKIYGEFEGVEYSNVICIYENSARIDFFTELNYVEETEIGFPYSPSEKEEFYGTRRSSYREDYKMSVVLPLLEVPSHIYKSAPFDIYKSSLYDTTFDDWKEIKHNIVNGYLDLYSINNDAGVSVFCDRVNGYSLSKNIFTLTVAFGYYANYWWGKHPLKGKVNLGYSLMFHKGKFDAAESSLQYAIYSEPVFVQKLLYKPNIYKKSIFSVAEKNAEVVTILKKDGLYRTRIFNNSFEDGCINCLIDMPLERSFQKLYLGKLEIKTI